MIVLKVLAGLAAVIAVWAVISLIGYFISTGREK